MPFGQNAPGFGNKYQRSHCRHATFHQCGFAKWQPGLFRDNFSNQLRRQRVGFDERARHLHWQVVSGTNQQAAPNKGYVTANNSSVVITLPPSPIPGDTIRATSIAGGWRIAQNAGQSIKSIGGSFSTYTVWTNHGNTTSWMSIASSADGTKLVASTAGPGIYTSTDSGVSWTSRTNISFGYYVASSADGTKLVAAGSNSIYTSTDSGVAAGHSRLLLCRWAGGRWRLHRMESNSLWSLPAAKFTPRRIRVWTGLRETQDFSLVVRRHFGQRDQAGGCVNLGDLYFDKLRSELDRENEH